ncbi:hypothetical protein [Rhodanobacter ginsenosidimutans]|uniref:Uncharacterized protein n=1 Tax=Rhodanobacter ginsenosidimutans TaxID=490571 RepID=A0ABW0K1G0_9GAMM
MKALAILYKGSVKYSLVRVALLVGLTIVSFAIDYLDLGKISTFLGVIISVEGVVVTIFGIWIAIIFPRLFGVIQDGEDFRHVRDNDRYNALVESLYRSCFVLCAACFVFFLVSFFDQYASFFFPSVFCFCAYSLFSLYESLWTSVWMGEAASVERLNDARTSGALRRRRRG